MKKFDLVEETYPLKKLKDYQPGLILDSLGDRYPQTLASFTDEEEARKEFLKKESSYNPGRKELTEYYLLASQGEGLEEEVLEISPLAIENLLPLIGEEFTLLNLSNDLVALGYKDFFQHGGVEDFEEDQPISLVNETRPDLLVNLDLSLVADDPNLLYQLVRVEGLELL